MNKEKETLKTEKEELEKKLKEAQFIKEGKINYKSNKIEKIEYETIIVRKKDSGNDKIVNFTAYNKNNDTVWTYKTEEFFDGVQFYPFDIIIENDNNGKMYLSENNKIKIIDLENGKIVNTVSAEKEEECIDCIDFLGIDENSNIYLSVATIIDSWGVADTLLVINGKNCEVLKKIELTYCEEDGSNSGAYIFEKDCIINKDSKEYLKGLHIANGMAASEKILIPIEKILNNGKILSSDIISQ